MNVALNKEMPETAKMISMIVTVTKQKVIEKLFEEKEGK